MKNLTVRARSRMLAMLLGALTLGLLLAGCGAGASSDPLWAVEINGHGYSVTTYQHLVRALRAIAAYNSSGNPSPTDWQTPIGRGNRASAAQNAVSTLVELEVAREQLHTLHISVSQQDISANEQALKNGIAQAVQQSPDDPTIKLVQQTVTPDVLALLSEQKADEQALANSAKVTLPTVQLRVIVTSTQAEAQTYQQQVQKGADFSALAKAHSLDSSTAAQGGSFGQVFLGQLPAAFDKALFGQKIPAGGKAYAVVPAGSQWVLCEISQPGTVAVQKVQTAQAQTAPIVSWLTPYINAAHVHTFVSGV